METSVFNRLSKVVSRVDTALMMLEVGVITKEEFADRVTKIIRDERAESEAAWNEIMNEMSAHRKDTKGVPA